MNEIVSHSIFQNTGFLWRLFSFIRTASIRTAFTIEVIRHLKSYWFPARFFVVWLVHRKQIRTPYNILVQYLFYSIEAAIRVVLCKKVFLKISQNSQENTCAKVSFLIKLQAWQKNHFYRTLLDGCFWLYLLDYDLFIKSSFRFRYVRNVLRRIIVFGSPRKTTIIKWITRKSDF